MGLSIALDTGVLALRASQMAVDTTAHNIANANTEGYSRQEVMFRAVPPAQSKQVAYGYPLNQLGLGVEPDRIRRLRDVLLDAQYRSARAGRDDFSARATALEQAEVTLNEPSDHGIQALLTGYFNALRDLQTQPESSAARAVVIEQGATLAAGFNRAARILTNQQDDLNSTINQKMIEINSKAEEVAALNGQIRLATVSGSNPNDLLDRRDVLLDDLAGLAGATFETGSDGTMDVVIGGRKLVDNVTVDKLVAVPNPANHGYVDLQFSSDNAAVGISGGEMNGLLQARDQIVPNLLSGLNEIAGGLITAVNAAHSAGYGLDDSTGLPFFTGTDALTIDVNATLRASPERLAASGAPGEPGNADNARILAGIQDAKLLNAGSTTLHDGYRAIVSALGAQVQQGASLRDSQAAVTLHLDTARQAVSGVSLDEEMTNLIKFQRAYQAAARIVTTVDELLDTLINRTT